MKIIKNYGIVFVLLFTAFSVSANNKNELPKEFQGDTWNSKYEISYDDLSALLNATVLDMGISAKRKLKASKAKTGTRFKNNRKLYTALEANRFYFEAFKDEASKQLLTKIRKSLEQVPSEIPLSKLKEKEQLAYWLNLYNVTVLEQLTLMYPIKSIEDELVDDDSFLNKKLLTVAGHKISLNYIHHQIILTRFKKNKDVMYGLYQGNIGSPNIRREAYTGETVLKQLESNANEFINSNRGVFQGKKNKLRVSKFYEQNKGLFPNFKDDLTKHLLYYANGSIRRSIENAKSIKTNVEDWTITDVYGTQRNYGGGINNNSAAMLDSTSSTANEALGLGEGAGGGVQAANMGFISESFAERTLSFGRFSPEQVELLKQLNNNQLENRSSVTVTDLSDGTDN